MNDHQACDTSAVSGNSQADDSKPTRAGKTRVKPRHLSALLKRCIVEQFVVRQSSEDVAEELGLPVRTVDDVIKLACFQRRQAA